jgi:hypothetical protein
MLTRVLWVVAGAAALLIAAGIAMGARFYDGPSDLGPPTPVLVATQTIPAGTPWTTITSNAMYVPSTLPKSAVEEGAIADPQFLTDRVAAAEILPGEMLTAGKFEP